MKTLNLTERLKDNSKPTITIGETVIEVNNDAASILAVMESLDGEITNADVIAAAKHIFAEGEMQKLFDMNLSFENYMIIVGAAMDLVTGTGENVGE